MNPTFWKGKKVLLTGHTGFKGGWLALWLQRVGSDLTGYSLPAPTEPSLFEVADVARGMASLTGDVRDLEHLRSVIEKVRPEIIIHMAAQSLVRHSYHNPVETYSTNVMGTVNVLEAVRQTSGVSAVLCVTSDKCYENRELENGYSEDEILGGHDPYSNSKGCAELVISAYRRSYFQMEEYKSHGVALASARAGNVIGGGDWAEDRLIPDIMKAVMAKQTVIIRNPDAVRPWQHVLEPLDGYLSLAERLWEFGPRYAEPWNFGPEEEDMVSVSTVVGGLTSLLGKEVTWKIDTGKHPRETRCLKLDCSKAKARLGWAPRLRMPTVLEWVVEWYKAYEKNEDMRTVIEAEISRFEDLLVKG